MEQNRFLRLAASALVWAALGCPVAAATVLPDFSAATFLPGAPITNRYFPTVPGPTAVTIAKGESPDGPIEERGERSTLGGGPEILGVGTTTVLDRAIENGLLVEETKDYYAQDSLGNVWYFGEDVTNYVYDEAGNLTGTNSSSSWRAGVSGALPGYIMPADPQLWMSFFQEFAAANDALDEALVYAIGLSLTIGTREFTDVLVMFETSSLDPAFRELKYYAPGVGLIRAEEGVDENFANPTLVHNLVSPAPVPLPAAFPLLVAGLGWLGVWCRTRRHRGGVRLA